MSTPLAKSDFVEDLIPLIVKGYPINTAGNANQGYFYRFDRSGIDTVLKHVIDPRMPEWLSKLKAIGLPTSEELDSDLVARIEVSRSLSDAERKERLASAPDFPERRQVTSMAFVRNEHVIVSVLKRANGICEKCGEDAPFIRRADNSPYLEVHHLLPLSQGGRDTVENAVALCPNCHRKEHHG